MQDIAQTARNVIEIEAESVNALIKRIDDQFVGAVQAIMASEGRVIFLGIGKSGIIAQKIAATMSSTGTPAYFVHPVEGMHGDLGMIRSGDVVIALSNSGETEELMSIIPPLKNLDVTLVAMTGIPGSSLGSAADFVINTWVEKEACPLGLAPTSSTTATLVMGDALAVSLMRKREFKERDFAVFHPGGTLGRRLLTKVEDIMHRGKDVPIVQVQSLLPDIVAEMTEKTFGITAVVDGAGKLVGVISDGDLRRLLGRGDIDENIQAVDFMSDGAKTVAPHENAAIALKKMEDSQITSLFISDESEKPIGVIHMHDILGRGERPNRIGERVIVKLASLLYRQLNVKMLKNTRIKQYLPAALLLTITLSALMAETGCRRDDVSLSPPLENVPDQVIEDFFLIETEGEEVAWKLTAKRAEIYNDENRAEITVVKVDFYEEGEYSSTLTSDTGEIDTITNDMVARGHVVVNSMKEGAVLKTEELMWQSHTGLIVSDYPVTMERGDGIIRGQGFTATPGLSEFRTTDMEAILPEGDIEEIESGDDEGGE